MINNIIDFFSPYNYYEFASAEKKRFKLTVFLCFVSALIAIVYFTVDIINGVYYALPFYSILLITPLASLWLLKSSRIIIAKMLLLTAALATTFLSAISDPFEAGVFLLFVPFSIASFALVGFSHKIVNTFFSLLVGTAFFIAFFGDFRIPYEQNPPENYVVISLIINFIIGVITSILIVYFLVELNTEAESELKEKEKILISKNQELEKLNQELDRFVYSVSHDLRSPLSSILGLTNLAKFEEDPSELKKYMTMIQERVKAQDDFIKEIIEYSRNVRLELKSEEVHFKQFIQEQVDALRFQDGATAIAFEIEISEKLILQTDKARWKTILTNLIGNAIKYHAYARTNPFIRISGELTNTHVVISVEDNGSGISDEHINKIFEMFYRGTDASNGSGLGLFITLEAVKQLNGKIDVKSVLGKGSVFSVKVPVLNANKREG